MAKENEKIKFYNLHEDLCFSQILLDQDVNFAPENLINFIKLKMIDLNQEFLLKLRISLHETYKHYFEEDEEFEEDNGYAELGIKVFRIIKRKIPPKISESIDEGEYLGFITVIPKNQFSTSVEIASPPGERYDFMKLLAREIAGDTYKDPHQLAPDNRPGDQQPAADIQPGDQQLEIVNQNEVILSPRASKIKSVTLAQHDILDSVIESIKKYIDPYCKDYHSKNLWVLNHFSESTFKNKLLPLANYLGYISYDNESKKYILKQ